MADRQREFLMAANHYRAGRITIDDFKKKVLAATAAQGSVAVVFGPQGDSEDVNIAVAEIKSAGAKVVKFEFSAGELPEPEHLSKNLQPVGAVVMIGLAELASVSLVAKEAGCPVFVVPHKDCQSEELTLLAEGLPGTVALVGKGQAANAGTMAARVARP